MGKLQQFEITFDKSKVMYSPGESISGTVNIKVGQALPCKAIKVNCNGFCGITTKVNDTAWTVEEQYFNSTISVSDKGTLKQGEHTFPFKFLIPASAPTSFEGNYGKIIYRVRAFIETPRFAKDYNAEKAFYLLRLLNLNEVPDIWGICLSEVKQQFTYMLVKTGTVVLKAQTDMKGYTPGQIIQVTVNIHNQSGKNTGNMAASLMQRVTYETKRSTHDLRNIVDVEGGAVKAGKEVEWKEQIIIPPLPQSSLAGCDLIKIEYYVKVSLKSPDVMLTLPIHIGNVSLDKKRHPSKKAANSSSAAAEDTPCPGVSSPDSSTSATTPTLPHRPAPKPAPRPTPRPRVSSHNSPSAPPAEYRLGAEGGAPVNDGFPNKRQSQLVSPNAFSYAPGLFFPQNQPPSGPGIAASGSTGATAPYPSENATSSAPTALILPPEYDTSAYPQAAFRHLLNSADHLEKLGGVCVNANVQVRASRVSEDVLQLAP
ncbi:arrestin domain-containing protein 1a isoform X1 [Platichthys flesus]|uniref:arrestin domain-containing protein 1a isoform X1 n=1 Tax=Platichthys flesus TaxID=8260 RepID=UPI002DB695E0|nr:arrestin domain-containing protein 1a isoform X1 [Platichthys flesus]